MTAIALQHLLWQMPYDVWWCVLFLVIKICLIYLFAVKNWSLK